MHVSTWARSWWRASNSKKPPSEAPPAAPAPADHLSRRRPRLPDLSSQLDDACTDRRVRHCMSLSNAAPRANQPRANHLPARKRKRYEALLATCD